MNPGHKVGILSLGCPRNLVDSEGILGRLEQKGYPLVELAQADIGIVNTCAFIEEAKRESIDAILDLVDLKKQGRLKKIIVYGCLAQRYKEELIRQLPEVDAFIGRVSLNHDSSRVFLTPGHYAYLKICEGCINKCSYCVIPKIKGEFRSLDVDAVLKQVKALNKKGVSELNIIGQDITGFGRDLSGAPDLAGLLKKIMAAGKDIPWVRLLYLHPSRISDGLLELIKNEARLCKYIDLPIQHINNRILKLMRRPAGKEAILRLIDKIRKAIPAVALRTSLIVGFPSESDREFEELLKFIEEVKFERLGAFIYSRETGTAACNMKGQIPAKIKAERFNRLMARQQDISRQVNSRFLGKDIEVLIDEKGDGFYLGRSQHDAPEVDGSVYVCSARPISPGDFVKAKIIDTLEYDLVGRAA